MVTLKNHHFISRERTPAPHLFLLFICLLKLFSCCYSYPSFVFLAKKFVVLSSHFRRQKDSKKSPVTSKVMLVVAFDGITSTAEHLTSSGIWIILTSLLSSPTIFLFCWRIRGADGQYCILLRSVLAAIYEEKCIFGRLPCPYFYSSFNVRKKKIVTYSGDSVLIICFAKSLLKVSKIQTIIVGILSVSIFEI